MRITCLRFSNVGPRRFTLKLDEAFQTFLIKDQQE